MKWMVSGAFTRTNRRTSVERSGATWWATARASTLRSGGTASSRSITAALGPDLGSLASTSGRLPGANSRLRMAKAAGADTSATLPVAGPWVPTRRRQPCGHTPVMSLTASATSAMAAGRSSMSTSTEPSPERKQNTTLWTVSPVERSAARAYVAPWSR